MNIYTIGYTQKNAETFFEILKVNRISKIIDIRLNNKSQLAGFTKGNDLKYFLKNILEIEYMHILKLAPSKDILDSYRNSKDWESYVIDFTSLINSRNAIVGLNKLQFEDACLLCSEPTPEFCHRRLVAEMLMEQWKDVNIIHL